jgi:hypothetical protein
MISKVEGMNRNRNIHHKNRILELYFRGLGERRVVEINK